MDTTPPWLVRCRDGTGRVRDLGVAAFGERTALLLPDNGSLLLDPTNSRLLARALVVVTSADPCRPTTGGIVDGEWRPAIFTQRRHFVPKNSPRRSCLGQLVGTGLCGFPGYLADHARTDRHEFRNCADCRELHDWLSAET